MMIVIPEQFREFAMRRLGLSTAPDGSVWLQKGAFETVMERLATLSIDEAMDAEYGAGSDFVAEQLYDFLFDNY